MTHKELIAKLKKNLILMSHTHAATTELAFKVKKNFNNLIASTPASKAIYVVTLDRQLNKIGKQDEKTNSNVSAGADSGVKPNENYPTECIWDN
jgi:hypothetical protein